MKVLCLIDVQNDFIDGSLGTSEAQTIVQRIVKKINNITDKNNTLIFSKQD